jgi:hypothetical protein
LQADFRHSGFDIALSLLTTRMILYDNSHINNPARQPNARQVNGAAAA